jgi:hypothetical protein
VAQLARLIPTQSEIDRSNSWQTIDDEFHRNGNPGNEDRVLFFRSVGYRVSDQFEIHHLSATQYRAITVEQFQGLLDQHLARLNSIPREMLSIMAPEVQELFPLALVNQLD